MTDKPKDKLWIWRAWTSRRERIADCGYTWATDAEAARLGGWRALGGPYMAFAIEMQVDEIDIERRPLNTVVVGTRP